MKHIWSAVNECPDFEFFAHAIRLYLLYFSVTTKLTETTENQLDMQSEIRFFSSSSSYYEMVLQIGESVV